MSVVVKDAAIELADDVCALPLVRRMAALLDRDPGGLADGDPLPRGWHVAFFNPPTPQGHLRHDGAAYLGVKLPDLGMPRLMMGGRRIEFLGDIPIGQRLRRSSRAGAVTEKSGKSGRFALVDVEHRITVEGDDTPKVVETTSYVLREADTAAPAASPPTAPRTAHVLPPADLVRSFTPDETVLFRYSAITDNPHRIHYDLPYALSEGYPALVVNGTVPTMFLLEMFREHVGAEPAGWRSRNLAPILCGRPLTLTLAEDGDEWLMRAYGSQGEVALEARAWA
jgi:3-methylfumaryl-CoA hydratase